MTNLKVKEFHLFLHISWGHQLNQSAYSTFSNTGLMSDFKLASVAAIFRYQLQTYYLQFYLHINQSSCVCIALNHSQRKCLAQLEDQRNPAV